MSRLVHELLCAQVHTTLATQLQVVQIGHSIVTAC